MSIRAHLSEHHGFGMAEEADEGGVHDLHHYHHTYGKAGHTLGQHLNPNISPKQFTPEEAQRAKTNRWKPQ